MRRHLAALAVLVAVAILILLGCGSGSVPVQNVVGSRSGSLVVFGSDAPLCSVIGFEVTITGATLTPAGGGDPVSVISSQNPVQVDFASLVGFATVLNLVDVPAGRYSQVTLTLSDPQITVVTGSPPTPTSIETSLTSLTVTVNINPLLEVTSNGSAGLMVDFRLLQSVQVDELGQVTGLVDPTFRVSPTVISVVNGLGELDELHGLVESVSTTSADPSFVGSFNLQIRRLRAVTVYVTDRTRFHHATGLSDLAPGTFVEVHAFVNANGRIVAREVDVQERENENERRAAFVGLVVRVNRNPGGLATDFALFVRREHPDVRDTIPLRSVLRVNLTPETRFGIAALGFDFGSRLFNPATLGVGQHVVAHGRFEPGTPPTLDARAVVLRRQAIVGNFEPPLLAVGGDGKTGGFKLVPCNPIFQSQPITVVTFPWTFYVNVDDLNDMEQGPLYVSRGLLFYEQTPGSVNGVSWNPPPPVYVQAAGVVRELD